MPRHIDADELEKAVEKYFSGLPIQGRYDILEIIAKAPTIDAVEVVRCKDCEHYDGKDGQCPLQWSGDPYIDEEPQADFYCAYGERR